MSMEKIYPSEAFKVGLYDDDGSYLPDEIVGYLEEIEKKESENLSKEVGPTVLNGIKGKVGKKVMDLINDHSLRDKTIYLWNKLSDPDLHPNDYIKLEDMELEFKWILSPCQGVKNILDEKLFREELIEVGNTKIKESLNIFKEKFCQHRKGCCKSRHYFIGVGEYTIDEKTYSGIHIIPFPDYNTDQKEFDIKKCDEIYGAFLKDQDPKKAKYELLYFKRFKSTLAQIAS